MAYQALYRKYRPLTFSEVVGQEHITETLKNELASNKIVHAYLFTGTRGTGKTSCAKILAKAINCLNPINGDPCLECESCKSINEGENTDISEIDAASNNSVDSIRELREQVSFAPASSKYRVYIIDEVHMLTIQAFNALLKTLEEPPGHIVFILATTEVHKLPATILSRCQRFDFRRIDNEYICSRIQHIAEKEGLSVSDDAATLIAAAADGGMRDALSILDLCASNNREITEQTVESVCAMAGNDYLIRLTDFIKSGDTENALLLLDTLHSSSVDMLRLLSELIGHYRNLMIIKTIKSEKKPIVCSKNQLIRLEKQAADYDITDIMTALDVLQRSAAAMQSGNRRCEMEMAVIRLCKNELSSDFAALEKRIRVLENAKSSDFSNSSEPQQMRKPAEEKPPAKKPQAAIQDDEIPAPTEENEPAAMPESVENTKNFPAGNEVVPVDEWDEILSILRKSCPIIAGVLNQSKAYTKGDFLLIDAPNSQFKSMINSGNASYRDSIRKAAMEVLHTAYKLGPYNAKAPAKEDDPLAALAEKLKSLEIN